LIALKTTIGENMKDIFPSPITNLPEADIQLDGITAYLSQAETHQILFMRFDKDADFPEHYHDAQIGVVLEGKIELTIGGEKKTYTKGDRYYIPKGVKHSGKIFAGYADITFFNEPSRYSKKTNKNVH
jgi:ethanolamine utilization protein EutQ (cupin superfamily)